MLVAYQVGWHSHFHCHYGVEDGIPRHQNSCNRTRCFVPAWSPDSLVEFKIQSNSATGGVRFWNASTGENLGHFKNPSSIFQSCRPFRNFT